MDDARDRPVATAGRALVGSEGRAGMRAAVRLPTRDLEADLQFFGDRLGFRLEAIYPADRPEVAILSGFGVRIQLQSGASGAPATLCLLHDGSEALAEGESELIAPNGTRIELRRLGPPAWTGRGPVARSLLVHKLEGDDSWQIGRAGMQYRDLIGDRLGGAIVASHIRIPGGGPVADMVHFHAVRFQLIHCYRGWVKVVYEDQGPAFELVAGSCILQPPGIRHQVLEASRDLEVIELAVPAAHLTTIDHQLVLPSDRAAPERTFGGQRFCHHRADNAVWQAWRLAGFEARDTGIGAATGQAAGVHVIRRSSGGPSGDPGLTCHDADALFTFVLAGYMTLQAPGRATHELAPGDAFVVPAAMPTGYRDCSPDLELLEVSWPGRFRTTRPQVAS